MYQQPSTPPPGWRRPSPPRRARAEPQRADEHWVGERWVRVPPAASEGGDWTPPSPIQVKHSASGYYQPPLDPALAEPAGAAPTAPNPLRLLGMALHEGAQVLIPALLLAALIHGFFAQATVVYGQSMEPSLHERERLIIDKISYRLRVPARGDIVVLDLPEMEEKLVKRIVGLPGETVAIQDGFVYIDGEPLAEDFPHVVSHQTMLPTRLGPLQYYVLGDNRSNSNDSRAFGSVHRESIIGRVWLRYWPLPALGQFP